MMQRIFRDSSGRLRSGWRFFLAAVAFILIQILAGWFAVVVTRSFHNRLFFEAVFRPLALLLMIVVYGLMVKFADHSSQGPLPGQGFVRHRGWLAEFMQGLVLGLVMILLGIALIKGF